MIKPVLQDQAFLEDVRAADPQRLHVWWLGQSGFLLMWQGVGLLFDPYLSDALTRKYAGTDKPHVRMTERVIAPEKLDFIRVVTSSHNHTDHLDAETLLPLLEVNPNLAILVGRANLQFAAQRLHLPPERLTPIRADGEAVPIAPFTFHAIPSAHEQLETDENGDHRFIGYIVEVGGKVIYHSGDACPYPGLVERLRKWRIDLAFLPINGREAERKVAGNFTAAEVVQLARDADLGMVVPCHYEMFEFNTVSPREFIHLAQAAHIPFAVLRNGERLTL